MHLLATSVAVTATSSAKSTLTSEFSLEVATGLALLLTGSGSGLKSSGNDVLGEA
eukprot:CAMPEP_0185617686 /NCGR_PEP_ID=MMETSP0436-20130131/44440_1 /TAXON_ID=626734 ORGANISM="Favella taraikaensis, Strain Fe Narragansett Bay" /NCGR_SAMPLE_ID=MMETSP0436 /ASSEMBLY_ACC=CAM_ASM_000390 /LENGTH=54 /DNA_ID=CAMNT_0028255571 /DNA_START=1 /DNA_END=165 /DNA_ORIENTATION=-